MEMRDRIMLANWLNSRVSLDDVESFASVGLVENVRFTPAAKRAFRLIWEWSSPRFSGRIGMRQDALYNRHGREFLEKRFARCNRIAAKLARGE